MIEFFLLFTIALISAQSSDFLCKDSFPLVTDFGVEDCDSLNYIPDKYHNCLPGCEAIRTNICNSNTKCPAGYKCSSEKPQAKCVIDEESCLKYYNKISGLDNKYNEAMWKPECAQDGSWKAKQCKGYSRCFCFDDKGNRIYGDAFYYEADDMTCACSRRRAELEATSGQVFVSLHCDSMGNYEPLQCDSGQCWCVEPKTGDLTSPVVPEKLMTHLNCYNSTTVGDNYLRQCESHLYAQEKIRDEFAAHGQTVNFETLKCLYDGSYGPYKIVGNSNYCVWRDNSQLGSYQSEGNSARKTMNCQCARDKKVFELSGRTHLLVCLNNGNYNPVQNFEDEYYCVDSDGYRKSEIRKPVTSDPGFTEEECDALG